MPHCRQRDAGAALPEKIRRHRQLIERAFQGSDFRRVVGGKGCRDAACGNAAIGTAPNASSQNLVQSWAFSG